MVNELPPDSINKENALQYRKQSGKQHPGDNFDSQKKLTKRSFFRKLNIYKQPLSYYIDVSLI